MSTRRILLIAFLLTVVVRGALVLTKPMPVGDESSYIEIADSLAEGRGYGLRHKPTFYPPLYPLCVFAVRAAVGDGFLATRLLFVLFGPLLVWSVFCLTRELYSSRIAALAAVLAAIFPSLTGLAAYWGQSETLYVALATLGVASWIRGMREGGFRPFFSAGIWLAASIFARTEGLPLVATLLVVSLVRPRLWPRAALGVLLPVLLIVLARSWINLETKGRFTPDPRLNGFLGGGITRNVGAFKALVESGELAKEGAKRGEVVGTPLLDKAKRNGMDLLRDGSFVFPPFLLFPAALGLILGWRGRRRRAGHLLVVGCIVATAGFVMAAFVKASYVALFATAFLPWTAVGLLRIDGWLRRRWGRLPSHLGTTVTIVVLLLLVPFQPIRLNRGGRLPVEYYRGALWIRANSSADTLVLVDSINLGGNTHRDYRYAGGWSVERAREYGRRKARPTLLLVGDWAWKYAPRMVDDARAAVESGAVQPAATFEYKGRTAWVIPVHDG